MPAALPRIHVGDNRRFLATESGDPFFWLGDTAWELFHRTTIEEAETYLENRRRKGFSVIQAVALAELDGLPAPNTSGHTPLIDLDPTQPNEAYFRYVDAVIDLAAAKGLYIGLLPTWGDKVVALWGLGRSSSTSRTPTATDSGWARATASGPISSGFSPYFTRVPDQGLLLSDEGERGRHVQVTRDGEGRYAFVYIPNPGQGVRLDLTAIAGENARASWYDPRSGQSTALGDFPTSVPHTFTSPGEGQDWVLVLDSTREYERHE